MSKLVCESLDEFYVLEAEKNYPGQRLVHAVKTAPGRTLRKLRAIDIMKRYKGKLERIIEKITPKYQKNIESLVTKTKSRLDSLTGDDDEQKNIQRYEILDDLETNMKQLLTAIHDRMNEQLKVFADSIHDRLEREGTLTGVKFYPEEKTNLLSRWKRVEEDINVIIQKKLIDLIDNSSIKEFQELKAKLHQSVKEMGFYHPSLSRKTPGRYTSQIKDEISDPKNLIDEKEKELYDFIIKDEREFDTPYLINKDNYKSRFHAIPPEEYLEFKIDNVSGKVGYAFYRKNKFGKFDRSEKYPDIQHFIDETRVFSKGEHPYERIQMSLEKLPR